ncbi:SDR family NAD(P)-dependent oxidoreductase [Catenovulum sp. SX2]|uniref:SDR family NAD(P)-dependent oxidoreductase n=1 Tax=Catenovulum sp. SX2 TaxID=3398614 RepID=UPI003F876A79
MMAEQSYTGKTIVVTGGGSGIGKETCLQMAKLGGKLIIMDVDEASAAAVQQQIIEQGGQAQSIIVDISNTQAVKDALQPILAQTSIDVLVNNAGIAHIGNIENTAEEDLDRIYQVNVKGVYNMLAAIIPAMKEQKSGVILNLASIASSVGISDRFAYSMSKGAVLTMTYSVARDYIDYGIRCNCISPGRVHTPFVDNFLAKNYPDKQAEMFEKLSKSQPIGRMAEVAEIAALICYLCSEQAAFITGSNFPIDGGFVTLNN